MNRISSSQADLAGKPSETVSGRRRRVLFILCLIVVFLVIGFLLSLSFGSVRIPLRDVTNILTGHETTNPAFDKIVWNIRLPKAITAILAGAALSMAGLQMQTIFRNPLADPFVLGVNSGSSLGVAIIVLALGPGSAAMLSGFGIAGNYAIVLAATIGAGLVLLLIMLLSTRVDLMTLLIMGLMIGYATAAIVNILMFFAMPERLQAFFSWTYGNFGTVTWVQMNAFVPAVLLGLAMCVVSSKVMNAFLLGESYARSMGVNIAFWRTWILMSASLLTGAVTGFCGPIGFIGVAVPHLSRSLLQTSDHRILFPAVLFLGGFLALMADFVAQVPGSSYVLPLNSITALMGAPVIVWLLLSKRNLRQAFSNAE